MDWACGCDVAGKECKHNSGGGGGGIPWKVFSCKTEMNMDLKETSCEDGSGSYRLAGFGISSKKLIIVRSASQGISRLLWKKEVRYLLHKSLPLVRVLGQMTPIHTLQQNLPKIHFNIIFPSMSRTSSDLVPSGFLINFFTHF
jgi:hypothetical protein